MDKLIHLLLCHALRGKWQAAHRLTPDLITAAKKDGRPALVALLQDALSDYEALGGNAILDTAPHPLAEIFGNSKVIDPKQASCTPDCLNSLPNE